MPTANPTLKAWRTIACGITSIVCANTRGEAKHTTQKAANDAGWQADWKAIKCRRAPEYDLYAVTHGIRGRCESEEYANAR